MVEWLKNRTFFLTLHGSQAYGLANELSDVDVKGVCVPPREVEADLFQRFEQAENDKAVEAEFGEWKNPKNPKFESVIYSLRKFFILAAGVNPNIIEVLWTEPDSWLIRSEWAYRLMDLRHKFLSTKAKFTFSGYAYSQLAKIERHRKWIVQGELEQPKREDFGLPPVMARGTEEIFSYIKARVEQWNLNQFPLEESARADLKETIWDLIYEVSQVGVSWDNWPDVYANAAIQKMAGELNLKDEVVHLINAERAYNKAKKNFESWLSWKKERNPARRLLEVKCGYDCYNSDTQFLTETGWKFFDEITPDLKLATVNPTTFQVQYHPYIERFDGTFTGNLYHFTGQHTDISVTPNHKMWVRIRERNTGKTHGWEFKDAAMLPTGFNVLRSITPLYREGKKTKLPIQDCSSLKEVKRSNLLKLIGWYVSEGSVIRDKERIKGISISQLRNGRVHVQLSKCRRVDSRFSSILKEYKHFRKEKTRWEMTWNIFGKEVGAWFEHNCGAYSDSKKLPRWVMFLSCREKEMILDAMMNGDGTARPLDNSEIYYTSSNQLANDVHELAFLCGFETSLWGPYEGGMFQVHINRTRCQEKQMTLKGDSHKESVTNHRIVCFTVPNHLLVTRRNGKIAIQGNSKHASHLVRLMRMGKEILLTGKVTVKRPDAEELLFIKNGGWSYEKVVEYAETLQRELDEEYKRMEENRKKGVPVVLPKTVNFVEINQIYHQFTEDYQKQF